LTEAFLRPLLEENFDLLFAGAEFLLLRRALHLTPQPGSLAAQAEHDIENSDKQNSEDDEENPNKEIVTDERSIWRPSNETEKIEQLFDKHRKDKKSRKRAKSDTELTSLRKMSEAASEEEEDEKDGQEEKDNAEKPKVALPQPKKRGRKPKDKSKLLEQSGDPLAASASSSMPAPAPVVKRSHHKKKVVEVKAESEAGAVESPLPSPAPVKKEPGKRGRKSNAEKEEMERERLERERKKKERMEKKAAAEKAKEQGEEGQKDPMDIIEKASERIIDIEEVKVVQDVDIKEEDAMDVDGDDKQLVENVDAAHETQGGQEKEHKVDGEKVEKPKKRRPSKKELEAKARRQEALILKLQQAVPEPLRRSASGHSLVAAARPPSPLPIFDSLASSEAVPSAVDEDPEVVRRRAMLEERRALAYAQLLQLEQSVVAEACDCLDIPYRI